MPAKKKTETENVAPSSEMIRRITTATIRDGKGKKEMLTHGASAIVAGRLVRAKEKVSRQTETEYTELQGMFGCLVNGKRYEATSLILPPYISDALQGLIDADNKLGVDFSITVFSKENEDSATGYEWLYKSNMRAVDNPLDKLLSLTDSETE